jgi:4-alpha-glucanotransferase
VKEEQLTDELKELIRTLTTRYRAVAEENAKKAAEEAQQ